jgi:hypothetical protein
MNQNKKPELTPDYKGQPWSVSLLKSLPSEEVRRLIRTYGANAVNAALRTVKP